MHVNSTKALMWPLRKITVVIIFLTLFSIAGAQRVYKPASILATGNWYKISAATEGIYKMDVTLFSSLGITGSIPSSQIRIFGSNGNMLPEANTAIRIDDEKWLDRTSEYKKPAG